VEQEQANTEIMLELQQRLDDAEARLHHSKPELADDNEQRRHDTNSTTEEQSANSDKQELEATRQALVNLQTALDAFEECIL
jgi:hypothetical protein